MARGGDVTSTAVVNIEVTPQTEDKPAEGRDIGLDRRFAYFRYRLRATAQDIIQAFNASKEFRINGLRAIRSNRPEGLNWDESGAGKH